jgi:hypothetical protein
MLYYSILLFFKKNVKLQKNYITELLFGLELVFTSVNEGFGPCGFILSQSAGTFSLFIMAQIEC